MGLAKTVLAQYGRDIQELVLVPSDGGRFEVTVDGKLVYSKLAEGRFPDDAEVIKGIDKVTAAKARK